MALNGSIKEFALTDIFQLISQQKKDGILTLTRNKETTSLLFKEGKIVQADEGNHHKSLGQKLLKAKKLTKDQLGIAQYRLENKAGSLETLLIELEFIPEGELKRLLRLFTQETLFKLFEWKEGDYQFEQKKITYNSNLISLIDTQFILMEAMRQIDEWPGLIKKIRSREIVFEKIAEHDIAPYELDHSNLDVEEDPFGSLDDINEDGAEEVLDNPLWLMKQIDGERRVQELINLAQWGAFEVYQGIAQLLKEKKIRERITNQDDKKRTSWVPKRKTILKSLIGAVVLSMTGLLFYGSFPSMQLTVLNSLSPIEKLKDLSSGNEQYFIRFALDLYHLKHNRYPATLQDLVDEGFFGTKITVTHHLGDWSYRLSSEQAEEYHLSRY